MKKFEFPLESLLRYRESRRDLCRQLLAQILSEQTRIERDRQALQRRRGGQLEEIRQLGAAGNVDIDRSASRRYYASQVLGEIRLLERNREVVMQQLTACRQALVRADQEVKALERLRQKRKAEFLYEQQRREQHELHESWLAVDAVRR